MTRYEATDTRVKITAMATTGRDCGPDPRTIGMGPMRITAPPLMPLETEPSVISRIPTNITANATKNSQFANEYVEFEVARVVAVTDLSFAWHSEHDQLAGSKHLLHTNRPHCRHT